MNNAVEIMEYWSRLPNGGQERILCFMGIDEDWEWDAKVIQYYVKAPA